MGTTPTATVLLCVILLATKDRSFVSTAPVGDDVSAGQVRNSQEQVQDANVRQLESLKRSLGETLSLIKTQSAVYADVDGHRQSHSDVREEVDSNGKLVARVGKQVDSETGGGGELTPSTKVQTEIDIPSKGIHRVDVQQQPRQEITDNGNRRDIIPDLTRDISNNLEKYTSYSGVQYSPLDMAEYVFWTGDEKGVTLAIEEFLQDGLMNRDEAIAFLQEIKYNLDYLQTHYSQQGLHSNADTQHRDQSKEQENSIQKIGRFMDEQNLQSSRMQMLQDNKHIYDISDLRENMDKKNTIETLPVLVQNPLNKEEVTPKSNSAEDSISDEEYEVLLERLRVADFLYTQYSLEEVIYQLAKVMFSQSLTRGSAEAQEALQKFTTFLESETEQGHISRSLEKKVLDVLIAALTDTLTEHPELVAAAREGLSGGGTPHLPAGNNILQQLLELGPDEKMMAKSTMRGVMPFKQQNQINREHLQATDRVKLPPVGLGKYKTH